VPATYTYTVQDPVPSSIEKIVISKSASGPGLQAVFHYKLADGSGNVVLESNIGTDLTAGQISTIESFITNVGIPLIIAKDGL